MFFTNQNIVFIIEDNVVAHGLSGLGSCLEILASKIFSWLRAGCSPPHKTKLQSGGIYSL